MYFRCMNKTILYVERLEYILTFEEMYNVILVNLAAYYMLYYVDYN